MIRNRFILRLKRYGHNSGRSARNFREIEVSRSGGSTFARMKLEGIDGKIPQDVESAAQFDSTRKIYRTQMLYGATD